MNCAYHSQNIAVVNCNGCGKPLCPACDHRIKGFPFCQDCIVSGVELLRNRRQAGSAPFVKKHVSPLVSLILSLVCPGLGAAYNGQPQKALIHFGVFVGLFQLAILTVSPVFVFGFIGMWLFAAVDAGRTAQLIKNGLTPDVAEDWIVQRFRGNPKIWGGALIGIGSLFFLQSLVPFRVFTRALLPLMLIGFGIYILRGFIFRSKVENLYTTTAEAQGNGRIYADAANFASVGKTDFRSDETFTRESETSKFRTWKSGS